MRRFCAFSRHSPLATKSRRIRTYIEFARNPFRIRTYEKQGERGRHVNYAPSYVRRSLSRPPPGRCKAVAPPRLRQQQLGVAGSDSIFFRNGYVHIVTQEQEE